MSEEKQPETPKKKQGLTAQKAVEAAKAMVETAAAKAAEAKATAEAAAKAYETAVGEAAKALVEAEKEYESAVKVATAKVETTKAVNASFTNKRNQERIFRREMGEPEFFHSKKDLVPARPVLTEEEQDEISRRVEIAVDHTPAYNPEYVLSPEFGGTSNYESGVTELLRETRQKIDRLKSDPYAIAEDIIQAEQDLKYLDSLYQNFYFGMNVFRTAKGGRDKIHE